MGIHAADPTPHQLLLLNQQQNFRIARHRCGRQALQQIQQLSALAQVAAGEFTDHPGMHHHLARFQSRLE